MVLSRLFVSDVLACPLWPRRKAKRDSQKLGDRLARFDQPFSAGAARSVDKSPKLHVQSVPIYGSLSLFTCCGNVFTAEKGGDFSLQN